MIITGETIMMKAAQGERSWRFPLNLTAREDNKDEDGYIKR